jgi:TrmH family RNA methyltransferase
MTYTKRIDSPSNPLIKQWARWQAKSAERRKDGVVLVEGLREVERALLSGWTPEYLAFPADSAHLSDWLDRWSFPETHWMELGSAAWQKLAVREGVDHVLGVFPAPPSDLEALPTPVDGLVLVAVETEKPGNLGALFRTADAAGVDAVLVVDPVCDPYHPQAIRNSLGGIFNVPTAVCSAQDARNWLYNHGLSVVLGHLDAQHVHTDADLSGPVALVVGPEDRGLAPEWDTAATLRVKIPMLGVVDSLNVSVSAAVLLYEARRQKK